MRILPLLLIVLTAWSADPVTQHWKVKKVMGSAPVAAMSDDQAAKLVGLTLQIGSDTIHFAGETYPKPSLKVSRTTRADFYKGYKMTGNPLKLPANLTTKDLGSTTLVELQSRKAIFYWDGYFFLATRDP